MQPDNIIESTEPRIQMMVDANDEERCKTGQERRDLQVKPPIIEG